MPQQSIPKGLALLSLSAILFATMGVCIRYASHTVNNETIVFFRNATGIVLLLPLLLQQGLGFLKTNKLAMHAWRALVGLIAMYGFFYAIAKLPLSNAMLFTYSSPVFIPLVAWLFLKEPINARTIGAALLGFVGVILVCHPEQGVFNSIAIIGIISSLLAAMAFVTVRALTSTEPVTRIVFYFAFFSTIISAIPLLWAWRPLTLTEYGWVIGAGVLATLSQLAMSKAYALAPASRIGPAAYLAIVVAGFYAWILWSELPDLFAIAGTALIFCATLICLKKPPPKSTA